MTVVIDKSFINMHEEAEVLRIKTKEKHPLPLIYKHVEVVKNKEREKSYTTMQTEIQ